MTAVIDMQAARGRRGGRTSAAAIERAGRERKAIALRQQGLSFEEIAGELGYGDRSGARKAVERGLSRWMRENDEELRARELERTELIIDLLWPLIDREAPDLKALDRLLKTMDHRAKITGLYGKRAAPPDTYAGAPDRAAETKVQSVVRYKELIEQMYVAVLESGYGSGVAPPDDDDEDNARGEVPSSDVTVADDELLEQDLPDGMRWVDGKPDWDGEWVDGKFVRSPADVSHDPAPHRHPPSTTKQDAISTEPLRVEALNINSDA